ncbi:MAG: phosphoribosylglycinamide formyltransferase [Polyangiales bacterium]
MALKLAVLISGRGSNLAAILQAIDAGVCRAEVAIVVSDRASAPGLELARDRGLPHYAVRPQDHADRAAWDHALADTVARVQPDLVVSAGFMRVLGANFLARFPRRIINVHPSLLPLFPGIDAPAQAVASGMRLSGCSVHLVDAGVDTGPVIAQAALPIRPDDDASRLHARIQRLEHVLLPRVVAAIADGGVVLAPELTVRTAPPQPESTLFSLGSPDGGP